ncbi:ATP-binding cassette domain-containing protein [Flavobacterium sp. MAH-1]|uniref:ATP-binding cassette domain-containing protein n=1 Tax=Flavobacterium agri TaxID=2743471 RepID=A0A7Y8Y1X8_9FLAO|nr:ABC transporter ATP-binding protein [Flavobacterium agri]NUY80888.1 ATP-binding cassette domain-containing protein [Flavobacterium agri]NYA70912.1 ATP-binding cassette domain-containing protein [Flavobacterium agri]
MKGDTVIKVENVSKAYQIGQIGTGTVSRDVERFIRTRILGQEDPFLKIGETNDRSIKGESDIVWSLRDINFEIAQGEAVGIIGRNGAGKSTLLKLLSRVTAPTTGSIKVKGRIASLLEVGTGFHPELTGRENIYLNGAILGMRKKEITRKLDEIIDFSGVERYIDTPVKRYSSGMYVRLAFAVAAHLESEILIVDEVLAVGDAEFQKKCLGKMGDISKGQGRTVLFVSHNMAAVKSFCNHGIVLENGLVKINSEADKAVAFYLGSGNAETNNSRQYQNVGVRGIFDLEEIALRNTGKDVDDPLAEDYPIEITTRIRFNTSEAHRYNITYHLFNDIGEALFSFHDGDNPISMQEGENRIKCVIPKDFFQSGNFSLAIYVVENRRKSIFSQRDIISFTVVDGERRMGIFMGREPGYIKPKFEWSKA